MFDFVHNEMREGLTNCQVLLIVEPLFNFFEWGMAELHLWDRRDDNNKYKKLFSYYDSHRGS